MKKKKIYFTLIILCTILLMSCRQPSTEESKDNFITIESDKIFLNLNILGSAEKTLSLTYGKDSVLPLVISDYDHTIMNISFSDHYHMITITALKNGVQEILITDQLGAKSMPLSVDISSLDLELSIAQPSDPIKVGAKFDLAFTKGVDIGPLNVTSSTNIKTTLNASSISVEALKDGSATVTLTDGKVSANVTFMVNPLENSLSISPGDSDLKVNQSRIYTIHQGIDGGELVMVPSNDGVVLIEEIVEKRVRAGEFKKDKTLNVTGLKSGTATITITDKNDPSIKATAKITVKALDHTLEIAAPTTTVAMTKSINLTLRKGEDISSSDLLIASSNTAVATAIFSDDRKTVVVSGVTVGQSTITVTDPKSNAKHSVLITVRALDIRLSVQHMIPLTVIDQNNRTPSKGTYNITRGVDIVAPFTIGSYDTSVVAITATTTALTFQAKGRGETSFTIKDINGVESNIITVKVSDIIFTAPSERLQVEVGKRHDMDVLITGSDGADARLSFKYYSGNYETARITSRGITLNSDGQRVWRFYIDGLSVGTNGIYTALLTDGVEASTQMFSFGFDVVAATK